MILDDILKDNFALLQERKRKISEPDMERLAKDQPHPKDLMKALAGPLKADGVRLIAEIKRASPSKGVIRADLDPVQIAKIYAENGAAAISVLTETKYFQGSLEDLRAVRDALGESRPPLLRKDFLWDEYQIYESRAYGADAVLLIVAILIPEQLYYLLGLSHRLGMKCLVEVHNEKEAKIATRSGARIIGVNNRDLNDFSIDINTTQRLSRLIPRGRIVVSESGIKDRQDIEKLKGWGINAVLVGESLVAADDIAARMKELR